MPHSPLAAEPGPAHNSAVTHPVNSASSTPQPQNGPPASPEEDAYLPTKETDVVLSFPEPVELPLLGEIMIYRWTKIFKGMMENPQLKEVIVHRLTHYQGLLMAIRRHNKASDRAALIGIRLVHDRNGSPLFWRLRRIAHDAPTEDFELESRTKSSVITPYDFCRQRFAEVLKQGWSDLGPKPISAEYFQRWLFQLIYRHTLLRLNKPDTRPHSRRASAQLRKLRAEVIELRSQLSTVLGKHQATQWNASDDDEPEAEARSWLRQPDKTTVQKVRTADGSDTYRITFSEDFVKLLRAIPAIIDTGSQIRALVKREATGPKPGKPAST